MKKLIIHLIILMLFTVSSVYAQEVNLQISVSLDGKYKQDTIYVGLYSTYQSKINGKNPLPEASQYFKLENSNRSTEFKVLPGYYLVCVWAYGYRPAKQLVIIPSNANYKKIEFVLKPQIIGRGGDKVDMSVINTVQLTGEFRQITRGKPVDMIKVGKVWKLKEKPANLKKGQWYRFNVNGQLTDDLLNPIGIPFERWLGFKMIYTGNEIIFDPSVYNHSRENNIINIHGDSSVQERFVLFAEQMNILNEEFDTKGKKAYRTSKEELNVIVDSMLYKYSVIEKEYPEFSQIPVEKQLQILSIKSLTLNFPKGNKNDEQFIKKQREFLLSPMFNQYFKNALSLIKKLDYNSYLLSGNFTSNINIMQSYIEECPELAEKHNISKTYFKDVLDNIIENSPDEKLVCSILYNQASRLSRTDETKSKELLDKLMNNYPYEKYIDANRVAGILARMNIKLGRKVPDFSVELLNGKTFTLNDCEGKFVFIDFWGSWCAPCLKELPHLKSLYSSVGRDKLEIIGLAQDKEEKLRKCITDNEIEYPNALASRELLAKFGVRSFPTSLLINPEGMIVRMNIRGEDAMNLIKYEIENHFK